MKFKKPSKKNVKAIPRLCARDAIEVCEQIVENCE